MGEQVYHGAQTCSGNNLRKCQDLGDSILLILGSFILLNVGINVFWKHLKTSLRILFHHFFPKDKQPIGLSSRPLCMRCTTDPKILYSRISSHFHRHPSFLLGHSNHFESWIQDTSDKVSRCCWMPPQCGHTRTPTNAPFKLWKGEMMGEGETLQDTAVKAQASLLSRPQISSQLPNMSKLDVVPLSLPQESKTKVPDKNPAQAPSQAPTHASVQTHKHTQSQTHTSEHTLFQPQDLEHTLTHTPLAQAPSLTTAPIPTQSETPSPSHVPPPVPCHNPASSPPPVPPSTPSHNPASSPPSVPPYVPAQAPAHNQVHIAVHASAQTLPSIPVQVPVPTPTQGSVNSSDQAYGPEQTSAYSPAQAPAYASTYSQSHDPVQTPNHPMTHSQADIPKPPSSQVLAHTPSHFITHSHAHTPVPDSTSAPASPTFAPSNSFLSPIPISSTPPAPTLPMTQTTTPASAPVLTRAWNKGTPVPPDLTSIPSTTAFGPSFSTGHVVYDARRVNQNIFFKYNTQNSQYSRKDLGIFSKPQEAQGLVNSGAPEQTSKQHGGDSDKPPAGSILGYLELGNMEWKISDDAKDKFSQPKTFPYCSFHPCSSEKKNMDSQAPVNPKIMVYTQNAISSKPCLHSPSTARNSLPTSPPPCTLSLPFVSPRTFVFSSSNHQKPSNLAQTPTFLPTSKSPQIVSSSHFPIPSQVSTMSQSLIQSQHPKSQGLTQDLGLQRTPCLVKDSRVPGNPGLPQNSGLQKNLSFTQNPGLIQNLGFPNNTGLKQNQSLHNNPGLTPNPSLHKNTGLHKFSGLNQDLYPNPSQTFDLHKNPGITRDSGPTRNLCTTQDAGILGSPCLTQPSGLHKNILQPDQRSLCFMQESGVCRNVELNQETSACEGQNLSRAVDQMKTDPSGHNKTGNVQDPGGYRHLIQYSGRQKNPCHIHVSRVNKSSGLVQTSCLHKSSGLTQDSGDYKNLGLSQDSDFHKNPGLLHGTKVEKRLSLTEDVSIYGSPEHNQDSNLYKYPRIHGELGPHKHPALTHGSGYPKTSGLPQEANCHKNSCLIPDPGLHKISSLAPGTAQVLGLQQTLKPTSSSTKSFVYKMQKEAAEQHVSWTPVPVDQNSCPAEAGMISADMQTFSEVPVLIELQPSSQQVGSQDWVYRPVDTVPTPCQNYRQMSMPPQINYRSHCSGPGIRTGHVNFDSRQRQLVLGRDKYDAVSSKCPHQVSSNSGENLKEWGYQNVMRASGKEGANIHQE